MQSEWQPIESAPTDGTLVLLWERTWTAPFVGQWGRLFSQLGWVMRPHASLAGDAPTHWMHLPPPPKEQADG